MSIIENYYFYNFNSIMLSKVFVNYLGGFTKIKKLVLYFIISAKQYKKNLLLFYIMLSLVLGGVLILKRKEIQGIQILSIELKNKSIFLFLFSFINFYLPLLNIVDNTIKIAFALSSNKKHKFFIYRLNYFSFPVISELDVLFLDYELLYDFINAYKFQMDIYLKVMLLSKDSGELLLRLYRFPTTFKISKKL